jgi:hypothetical protein
MHELPKIKIVVVKTILEPFKDMLGTGFFSDVLRRSMHE